MGSAATAMTTDAAMPEAFRPRHLAVRLAQGALLMALLAIALTQLPGLADVRASLAGLQPGWLVAVALVELGSVLSYVVAFRAVFCGRMTWSLSAQIGLSEQAANVLVPAGGAGGLALGAWALRRGGMATEHIARRTVAFFLITSSANFVAVVLAGTAVAAGVLAAPVAPALALAPAVLAALAMTAVVLAPRLTDRLAAAALAPVRRRRDRLRKVALTVGAGVREAVGLVRRGSALALLGAAGYVAFDVTALALTFAALGDPAPAGTLLLGYLLGQLGGLVPVPGGVGGTDGALIGALVLFGSELAIAAAAVIAYRLFQLWIPAVLGTIAFVRLRRTLLRAEQPAAMCAPLA